jgi:hypothetical protein
MHRFKVNRWWAFLFAICIAMVVIACSSHHASATSFSSGYVGNGSGDGSGSGSAGSGIGDPDVPVTSGKVMSRHGSLTHPMSYGAHSVGDGSGSQAWWSALRVVLQGLRVRYFGN